jgi:hypothetical protein
MRALLTLGIAAAVLVGDGAGAGPVEHAYVAGYATAVLERQLGVPGSRVAVQDGAVSVEVKGLASGDREKIEAALLKLPGVLRVSVIEAPPPPVATASAPAVPAVPAPITTGGGTAIQADVPRRSFELLPKTQLFAPLIADPRWPHFSAVYQRFLDDPQLGNTVAVSLGETLSLVRIDRPPAGAWELGLQTGVFSIFDLDAPSSDLVNADYLVGVPVTYRIGDFSAMARVFHQSSHLGDEFLLRNRVDRLNLSYEAVDLRLSMDLTAWLRLYAGGGYIFHHDPSELSPWSTQLGAEIKSPRSFFGVLRPIAGLDVQHRQQNGWNTDLSLRAGIQLENVLLNERRIQLMLEYFDGYSPNGQFFRDKIQYIGLGLHLYLF